MSIQEFDERIGLEDLPYQDQGTYSLDNDLELADSETSAGEESGDYSSVDDEDMSDDSSCDESA